MNDEIALSGLRRAEGEEKEAGVRLEAALRSGPRRKDAPRA